MSVLRGLGRVQTRGFASSTAALSNIGKQPIKLIEGTSFAIETIPPEFCRSFAKRDKVYTLGRQVIIKGPLGTIRTEIPQFLKVRPSEDDPSLLTVKVDKPTNKLQKQFWGTMRSAIQNAVIGTSEGHMAIVKFVGTGYRAILEKNAKGQDVIALKLGFPYTPKVVIPKGIKVSSPNPARLVIEGCDKQQVKLFAAVIREYKKPEPYKGKGIFVDDETIVLKEKKIK
ncbi:mitochondrial 54S ribosomal protein uL6m [Lodderomyces beijingensis]|uniref:Large ribosomal subunit protein uL6 alpha-beta domain-containing protein n=1 Tax=Lodderomyces beijingensis TaxID=1775926 RepID=A0ABP0ZG39_9ASCO